MLSLQKLFTLGLLVALFSGKLNAAVNTWIGGTGNWDTASNWSLGSVPSTSDTVVVNDGDIFLNTNVTLLQFDFTNGIISGDSIATITITSKMNWGQGALNLVNLNIQAAAICNVDGPPDYQFGAGIWGNLVVDGTLNLASGYLISVGSSAIINGTMNWRYGTVGDGLIIGESGILNITDTIYQRLVDRNLINFGTVNWDAGLLQNSGDTIINNGVFNVNFNGFVDGGFPPLGSEVFSNNGTLNVAAGKTFTPLVKFVNEGTINLATNSTLNLASFGEIGGSITGAASSKIWNNCNGCAIFYQPTAVVNVPKFEIPVNSEATIYLENGANFAAVPLFNFFDGTVNNTAVLPGGATYFFGQTNFTNTQNLNFTGTVTFDDCWVQGVGNIEISTNNALWKRASFGTHFKVNEGYTLPIGVAGGVLDPYLGSVGYVDYSVHPATTFGSFTNNGTVNWLGSGHIGNNDVVWTNNGTININCDTAAIVGLYGFFGPGAWVNNGSINLAANTDEVSFYGQVMTNDGSIVAAGGAQLSFGGLVQNGTISAVSSPRLVTSGTYANFNNGSTTSGFATLQFNAWENGRIQSNATITGTTTYYFWGNTQFLLEKVLPPTATYFFESGITTINVPLVVNNFIQNLDGTLEGTGSLTVNGDFDWFGGEINLPTTIGATSEVLIADSIFFSGLSVNSNFTNNGTITLRRDSINLNTAFQNNGLFQTDASANLKIAGSGSFVNAGTFKNCSAPPIDVTFEIPFNNSGSIFGTGGIFFNAGLTNNGTTNPGCSPGHLHLHGNFSAGQAINIEVLGTSAAQQDKLVVHGNMTAGGTLNITAPAGMTMTTPLQIIQTMGSMTGSFQSINLPQGMVATYHANGLTIHTTSGTPPLEVSPAEMTMPNTAGSGSFNVASTQTNWKVTDDASWITCSPTTGSLSRAVTINRTANTNQTTSRTGIVTVKKGTLARTVTVTQGSANGSTCVRVRGQLVSNLTPNSATIGWAAVAGNPTYELRFRRSGTTPWTTVTTTNSSVQLNNLIAGSTYQFNMRTRCSATSLSDYTSNLTFATPPVPPSANRLAFNEFGQISFENIEAKNSLFQIYPNPASSQFFVRWEASAGIEPSSLEAYDMSGRRIFSFENFDSDLLEISTARLARGFNHLVIRAADGRVLHEENLMVE